MTQEPRKEDVEEVALLPCPFCGGAAQLNKHFKGEMYSLIHRCEIMGPILLDWSDKASRIRKWNTRALGYLPPGEKVSTSKDQFITGYFSEELKRRNAAPPPHLTQESSGCVHCDGGDKPTSGRHYIASNITFECHVYPCTRKDKSPPTSTQGGGE